MAKVAAWVYAAATVAIGAYSAYEGAQASSDQRRAQKAQQRIADVKAARERRQMLAKARINEARILAQGASSGTFGSSGVQSGAAQQNTQAASGISFLNQVQQLTNQASMFNQKAANHQSNAGTANAIGGVTKGYADLFGG